MHTTTHPYTHIQNRALTHTHSHRIDRCRYSRSAPTNETKEEKKSENKKYFIIDFNEVSKKPLKKIVSSQNAKRLSQSEIEKIIQFGLKSDDL